jgi:putative PEP-CTERM system TPR-repeat lipoprotein
VTGRQFVPNTSHLRLTALLLLGVAAGVYAPGQGHAATSPANGASIQAPMNSDTKKLLRDAENAQTRGDLGLAIIQLKNAVRLAPRNGEIRARLGMALLKSGDTRTAQRELRQAWKDNGPEELVVPALLDAMVVRGEARELLAEFPDPLPATQSPAAPDILRARALALQTVGRSAEASAAMARSLSLRRDTRALLGGAKLAMQQGDLAAAHRLIDEAAKLSPTDQDVLVSEVALLFQIGDAKKTLTAVNEFMRRVPRSTIGRVMRIEALLELKQDALAQDEVDTLEMLAPDSSFVPYYRGLLLARANDLKGAWHQVQTLHPEFVLAQPAMAMIVADIAINSGNVPSGQALLATLVSRRPDFAPARVRLASVQLTLKRPNDALRTLEPIEASADSQVQAILGQANLQLGRFNDSIGALEKALASNGTGDMDSLKLQLAQSAFELGDTDKAIRSLESIKPGGAGNWETALPMISALMQAGKPDAALEVVNRVAKDAGRTPLVPFYRGRILAARNDFARAAAAFAESLAIDPTFVPALYFRGHVLVAQGKDEAGKKDLMRVIQLDPANVRAYIALAQIALYQKQEAQLVALLNSAIKVAPNDPAPRLALATYQTSKRKFQDARATLNALLQVSPNNPIALVQIGQIQFQTGQTDEAVETFRALAATYTNASGAYVLLAKALNATKDRLAAIDAARTAVELDPLAPKVRSLLVDYLFAANRPDEALASARDYASRHPGPDADALLVNSLVRLKRTDEANTYLTSRFAAKPDALLATRLSQLALEMGDRKRAVGILAEWVRKDPDDIDVRRQYGSLLLQTGDTAGARKEFEALLKQRPEDPLVLNNLSWILREEDPARAFSLVSLAAKVAPNSTDIMDTLGWMNFQRRDFQSALMILRRAHELNVGDAEVGYHYALALDATGRRAEAKALLQSIVDKNTTFIDGDHAKQLLAHW